MLSSSCRPRVGALLATAAVVAALLAVAPPSPVSAQTGEYGDVPDDAYYATPVADLAAESVFDGTECEAGFCPGEAIARKTMAVWIVRVLDGDDPPAVAQTRFDDVDAESLYAAFIERMADLGVTQGCGDGSGFCPDGTVTRAQMAAFISRAYDLPDGPDPGFSDVSADAWYAADAARLAASKISVGCGDGTEFCPGSDTTRAQMATFLWRAENPDWQTTTIEQSPPEEQTLLLSSDPDGDTFTFLGTPSSDPSLTVQTRGKFSVPVFLCGPSDFFTAQYMMTIVEYLNEEIASVFNRQSSGLVDIAFEAGPLLSPDVPWDKKHSLFDDPENNACMNGARAISDARFQLVIAYDLSIESCSGYASYGWTFLRVQPAGRNRTPLNVADAVYESALFGTAHHVLGMRPTEPYGGTSLFSRAIEEDVKIFAINDDGEVANIIYNTNAAVILSCYQRERLGWPVGEDSPPCHRLTPVGSVVSIVRGDRSAVVRWTEPTFVDTPVTGYTIRLYKNEAMDLDRWPTWHPYPSDPESTSQYAAMPDERSHTFEDLDPLSTYRIELDLQSSYGRTIVYSDAFRVLTSAEPVRVSELRPYGFTLSWIPIEGASRYFSGIVTADFAERRLTTYASLSTDSILYTYPASDGSDNPYWTTDFGRHPQVDLFRVPNGMHGNYDSLFIGAHVSDGDTVRDAYLRSVLDSRQLAVSDWNGTSFAFDQGVRPDTTYTILIVACGSTDRSNYPCLYYATVTVTTLPLSPPGDIGVTAGNTWVDLSWYTVPGAEAYAVCGFYSHCIHAFTSSTEVDSTILKEERIPDLEPGTTYAFEVKSCLLAESVRGSPGQFLCGPPVSSSVTTAATQPVTVPDRPDPVTATVGDTWAKLEWGEVPGADEYVVETVHDLSSGPIPGRVPIGASWGGTWSLGPDGRPESLIAPPASLIIFEFMQSETDYAFEIRACRTEGSTRACSDPRTVSVRTAVVPDTPPPPPDPPAGLFVAHVYAADLCLEAQWDPVPGAVEYRLSLNGNPYPSDYRSGILIGIPNPSGDYCGLNPGLTHAIGVSVCKTMGVSLVCSADTTRSVTIGPDSQ